MSDRLPLHFSCANYQGGPGDSKPNKSGEIKQSFPASSTTWLVGTHKLKLLELVIGLDWATKQFFYYYFPGVSPNNHPLIKRLGAS